VLKLARDRGTAFEVCLTSNLQTGVVRDMTHHPLVDMLDLKLMATLNTDDPGVSDCTLTDEYETAVYQLGLGYKELRHMTLNAAQAAFLPEPSRKRLVAHFEKHLPVFDNDTTPSFQSGSIPFLYSPLD
jgi:adenosine deaminase